MRYNIAIITPISSPQDHMANTILDGFFSLHKEEPGVVFRYVAPYAHQFSFLFSGKYGLREKKFISFARKADLILLCFGKYGTNNALAERINMWDKTAYIDGSELGKNTRFIPDIQQQILEETYTGVGGVDGQIKKRCVLYFRRERPYPEGVIPLPFGIESRYTRHLARKPKKDIDFVSIFGQDKFPPLRREATDYLKEFCRDNGFVCVTDQTRKIPLIRRGPFSQKKFYKILARAKVGISIGGGGFDTGRFWEILGNNCLLFTERVAIFKEGGAELNYKRIYQFDNMDNFKKQLETVATFLRTGYNQKDLETEYQEILKKHSTKVRAVTIINEAKKIGLLS